MKVAKNRNPHLNLTEKNSSNIIKKSEIIERMLKVVEMIESINIKYV